MTEYVDDSGKAIAPAEMKLVAFPSATQRKDNFKKMLEIAKPNIAALLPAQVKADRILAVYLQAAMRDPLLLECDQFSIMKSLLESAKLGLEINSPMGEAYLIRRKNNKRGCYEANFQVGYQGYIKLGYNNPLVEGIFAEVVREGEEFEYEEGITPKLRHIPKGNLKAPIIAAYAIVRLKGAVMPLYRVVFREELDQARAKAQTTNVWDSFPAAMCKKTAIHRIAKFMPKSVEIAQAVAIDDALEAGLQIPYSDDVDRVLEGIEPVDETPTRTDELEGKVKAATQTEPKAGAKGKATGTETGSDELPLGGSRS